MKINVYKTASIVLFLIGLIIIYVIAEAEDAPGLIILGFSILATINLILFSLGNIIDILRRQNDKTDRI